MKQGSVMKGIVEGFYGLPWTDSVRGGMMRYIGEHGMTHYLFGPKDDPLFRERWRDSFTASEMARWTSLKQDADQVGLALGFVLSPGLDIDLTDHRDLDALRKKFGQWQDLVVSWFGLFWDDIESDRNRRDTRELKFRTAILRRNVAPEIA